MLKILKSLDKQFQHIISPQPGYQIGFRRNSDVGAITDDLKIKAAHERNFYCTEVHGKSLVLTKNPLFIFREDIAALHEVRAYAVWIVEWVWFERLIIFTIIANIFGMVHPASYDPDRADKLEQDAFRMANTACIILFTVECALKVIARGLICGDSPDPTYLGDTANCVDFLIVILSLVEVFLFMDDKGRSKMVLARFVRALRPLRKMHKMPHTQIIVSALIESVPRLLRWLLTVIFICMVFALSGERLFGTVYWNRCRLTESPEVLANGDVQWLIDHEQPRFCGGRYQCVPTSTGQPTYCRSIVTHADGVVEGLDAWAELRNNPNADYGYTGFHSFPTAFLTVFQVATMEGWSTILDRYQDGRGSTVSLIFITALGIFSGLLLLNLVLGVLWASFDTEMKALIAREAEGKEPYPDNIMDLRLIDLVTEVSELQARVQEKAQRAKYDSGGGTMDIIRSICYSIVIQPSFDIFMLCVICVNCGILAIDSHPPASETVVEIKEKINFLCTLFFTGEAAFKIFSLGFKFFEEYLNIADLLLVIAAVVELLAGGSGIVLALRVSRLLRIFKMMSQSVHVKVLLRVTQKASILTCNFVLLVLMLLFGVTVIGLQLFYTQDVETDPDQLQFTGFTWSFIVCFALLTGERWSVIMINRARDSEEPVLVFAFFIATLTFLHLILMNLFLGMFVAAFAVARGEVVDQYRAELIILREKAKQPTVKKISVKSSPSFMIEEDPEPEAEISPLFPKDVWQSHPAGPAKTATNDMNIFRMMQVKQSAGMRADRVVLIPLAEMREMKTERARANVKLLFPPASSTVATAGKPKEGVVALNGDKDTDVATASRNSVQFAIVPSHQCPPPDALLADQGPDIEAPPIPAASYHPENVLRKSPPGSSRSLECVRNIPPLDLACTGVEDIVSVARSSRRCNASARQRLPSSRTIDPTSFKELYLKARFGDDKISQQADTAEIGTEQALSGPPAPEVIAGLTSVVGAEPRTPVGVNAHHSRIAKEAAVVSVIEGLAITPAHTPRGPKDIRDTLPRTPRQTVHQEIPRTPRQEVGLAQVGCDSEAPAPVVICIQSAASHAMSPPAKTAVPPSATTATPLKELEEGVAFGHVEKVQKPAGIRRCCFMICQSPVFEPFVLLLIVISSFALAIDTPYMDPDSKASNLLDIVEQVVSTAFLFEMIVKMIAFGFYSKTPIFQGGQPGYFRSSWNWIDFTIVSSSVADFIISLSGVDGSYLKLIRVLRLLRTLRPLRLITRNKGLRIIVEALMEAMPTLLRAIIISGLFYVGFSILFMNLLKGELWRCSLDPRGLERPDIVDRRDCEALGGEWLNADSNFDHIGYSMVTALHMGTGEGWIEVLIDVVNSVGVEMQPRRNSRLAMAPLIIIFVWVASSFLVNLMIGVLTDQYQVTRDNVHGIELHTAAHRRWMGLQLRFFSNPDLLKPLWQVGGPFVPARKILFRVIDTKAFDAFIVSCILVNTIIMCFNGPTMSDSDSRALSVVSLCFLVIFNIEIVLKLFVYFTNFFNEPWNVFDAIIIVGSDCSFLIASLSSEESAIVALMDVFRILRVMRLVRICTFLRNYCKTMLQLIPALMNVSLLLLLLLFIYACLGIGIFSTLAPGKVIDSNLNFQDFGSALLVVLRVSTGEDWQRIMYDTVQARANCISEEQTHDDLINNGPRGCGTILGYPYFITFTSFVSIVLMNIIIAVILEGFQTMEQIESYEIYMKQLKMSAKQWLKVDTTGKGYLTLEQAASVMVEIPQPVGFKGRPVSKVAHQLRYLPIYEGKVHFRDVVVLSAKRVYTWMNHQTEQSANDVKIEAAYFARWCAYFPDVPRPDRSIESFLVGHVLVKKYIDELILRRKQRRRIRLAEAYINEQIQDALPLRRGLKSKLANLEPAQAAQAAGGRNAAGLMTGGVSVATQVGGPMNNAISSTDFEAPPDPNSSTLQNAAKDLWAGGQADTSLPTMEVGLVGSGFDFPQV